MPAAWRDDLRHVAMQLFYEISFLVFYTTIFIGGTGILIYVLVRFVRESKNWIAVAMFSFLLLFGACGTAVFYPVICIGAFRECLRSVAELLRLLYQGARAWVWRPSNDSGDAASALPQSEVAGVLPHPPPVRGGAHVAGPDDIPALEHHQRDGASAECAVCLGEVRNGEMAKLLPVCQHMFHQQCIDQWLRHRSTCPLCRCSAFAPPPVQRV